MTVESTDPQRPPIDLAPLDAEARRHALDVPGSFVVQAPAGSGKTGLLTQRLLALLAQAEAPEEVLAITFTRKAAGEMRQRVVTALRAAALGEPPDNPYERTTFELATRVLARSRSRQWELESHPARLGIRTIDALAQMLARSLPILSRAGAALDVEADPTALYDEAALRLLDELEGGGGPERELAVLLEHFDNDYGVLRAQLIDMLERRDHWLPHALAANDAAGWRSALEATLTAVVVDALATLRDLLPHELSESLWAALIAAAGRLDSPDAGAAALAAATSPVAPGPGSLALWKSAAWMLLSGDPPKAWRKTVDKRTGFPTTHRQEKQCFMDLIAQLARIDGALQAWRDVAGLPSPHYTDSQWRVLEALLGVLKRLAAHLRVVFTERGRVDYAEVAAAARDALGASDEPTDLALRLDYRLRHILVDEFQDTSHGQIDLLHRLTAGWTGTDGRTLFCVGDPMQSIYRFRQADVALFLKMQRSGIGSLRPATLTLARNFRSQAGIVDWVNRVFAAILPPQDNLARGAVRYTPAQGMRPVTATPAVSIWPSIGFDAPSEARRVVAIVRARQDRAPDSTIAILARTRNHLRDIATALRAAGLRFQAIELETLAERRAVRDLAALTRALCHRDDRVAWLAVLRAPYCGLKLRDLAILGSAPQDRTLWEGLCDPQWLARLSEDGRTRVGRVTAVLGAALERTGRRALSSLVEGTWLALGGAATIEEPADLDNARVFFDRLMRLEHAGSLEDPPDLENALADLHAAPDAAATGRLQLMTIHRAKGLEWDTVILPGLGRCPRPDAARLLYALDVETAGGDSGLILAAARARAERHDPLEAFVKRLEKERAELESARLLYVAATRARDTLHLLGHVPAVEHGDDDRSHQQEPEKSSLLSILWPALHQEFATAAALEAVREAQAAAPSAPGPTTPLRRLILGWQAPPVARRLVETRADARDTDVEARPDFDWATEIARLVGVVVHHDLERRVRLRMRSGRELHVDRALYATELREHGVPAEHLSAAADRVVEAIARLLADDRGRWILAPHAKETCEWALTADVDGDVRQLVIDRSFVDVDGTRWIIDYKTSTHGGGALEDFLAREVERYAMQLTRYASVVRRLGPEPVRTALYFPVLGAWRELRAAPVPPQR